MKKNIFNTVSQNKPKSNFFDLTHDLKFSFNMGTLIPTLCMDVVPGDVSNISSETMLRFSALIAPIMHRVKVTQHYFFVPNRILWDGWEEWITGNEEVEPPFIYPINDDDPGEETLRCEVGSVADYMGIPTFENNTTVGYLPKINAFPFAAYAKVWYDYYRDQNNVSDEFKENVEAWSILSDGDNSTNARVGGTLDDSLSAAMFKKENVLKRAWEHDYLTSALPFAQKGEQVMLPLGDMTDVDVFYEHPGASGNIGRFRTGAGSFYGPASSEGLNAASGAGMLTSQEGTQLAYDPIDTLKARTSELSAEAASINNLRRAFRLQEWLEKNARGGTRYVESILTHFGVRSSDARLQRPEYLGGSMQNMVISEVLTTAETTNSEGEVINPVGQMAGHGISVGGSRRIRHRAEEHGWIIGFISVMPQTAYQQGIAKKFSRFDRFEYYWPTFAHIGEQEILRKEVRLRTDANAVYNEGTFGYIPRYAEYRFENSRVAGEFRTTLNFWHLGRIFEANPSLNEAFIYPQTASFDRIFAVDSEVADTIYAHILNRTKMRRLMPKYGTPFM